MTALRLDIFTPLRLPLLVLAVTLGMSALLDYASGQFAGNMEAVQSRLQQDLHDVRLRQMQARNREASFRVDAETYGQLERRGLVGPEQRLAWVALVRRLSAAQGLSRSDFQLAAQRPYARLASDEGGSLRLSASRSSLTLEAAHEERILAFLDDLMAAAPGLLLLQGCQMEAARAASVLVTARCNLDWITLEP